jgi:peptidoglycan/LPS O-acetylase OafA/YrhL
MKPSPLETGTPAWIGGGRIPALDGLRALAVGLVIFSHAYVTHGFPGHGHPFHRATSRLGTVGVDIFFVLSGFLITTLLCREHARADRISLRAFYLRRVLRIVPAYVCFLLFVAILAAFSRAEIATADWIAAGTYTMNFRARPAWELGHMWSLSIEEHFYVLWPPLLALLPRRFATLSSMAVLLFEPALRSTLLLLFPAAASASELWTFTRLDSIAAGCLLALLSRTPAGFRGLDKAAHHWPLALAALILAMVAGELSAKLEVGIAPTVIALAIAVLVWAAVRHEPRYLETRLAVAVGVGSYSLYLWQELFLNPRRADWWNVFPQNLGLTALCAAVSYRFVERPFIRMKSRL